MASTVDRERSVANGLPSPSHGVGGGSAERPAGTESDPFGLASDNGSGRGGDVRSAIGFLRGEDNPFDVFVAPQSADDDFFCFHAPEIHEEAQGKIRRAIEKYALPNYRARHQLQPTRALLVRGARGAGKTHLLHAIQFRDDGGNDLLVRPRYFEKQYPFAEYVLKEVVRTLVGEEPSVPNPLRGAAERITRRLLVEAILSLSASDWLERTARPGAAGILLGRRWKKQLARQQELVHDLNHNRAGDSIASCCARHRLPLETARSIVADHIAQSEVGTRSTVRMRRSLLMALFDLGLFDRAEPLTNFLESGFAEPGEGLANTRAALVDDLLRTLIEVLAAVGVPTVLAFDNIERLLAPVGQLDPPIAQAFFSGIAQLIDGVHGLLILLFVEDGLWIQCTQHAIDSFARDRLLLGIRMRDFGHVAELQLGAPSYQAIEAMVRRRMAPLRDRIAGSDRLPSLFPFDAADLRAIAGHTDDVLRAALLRLRDRYDAIVLGESSEPVPGVREVASGAPVVAESALTVERVTQLQVEREVLQPKWDSAVARAVRRLETAPYGSLAGELHAGLGRWLTMAACAGESTRDMNRDDSPAWTLKRVETGITFGDHPTFGLLTVGHWQRADGGMLCRVGIGFILGTGSSMPRDLSVKLSAARVRPAVADEFVILWPGRETGMDSCDLPPGSRKVWEEHRPPHGVALQGLATPDMAWLLAFNDWANETSELEQPGWPENACRRFLMARTGTVLESLIPTRTGDRAEGKEDVSGNT